MKSYFLIFASALSVGTLASKADHMNAHEVKDLVARAIDPKTMDSTRLSVLLVLKTAIPSGPEFPQPTGDIKPDWYQKLPEDVKSLLPSLYPVSPKTSSARSLSATISPSVSTSSFVSTSDLVSQITAPLPVAPPCNFQYHSVDVAITNMTYLVPIRSLYCCVCILLSFDLDFAAPIHKDATECALDHCKISSTHERLNHSTGPDQWDCSSCTSFAI